MGDDTPTPFSGKKNNFNVGGVDLTPLVAPPGTPAQQIGDPSKYMPDIHAGGSVDFSNPDDILDPLHFMHDPQNPDNSFTAQLGKKGATHGTGATSPPTQAQAAQGAISDEYNTQARLQSASTVLTGGGGLLDDEPNTYSASRTLGGF